MPAGRKRQVYQTHYRILSCTRCIQFWNCQFLHSFFFAFFILHRFRALVVFLLMVIIYIIIMICICLLCFWSFLSITGVFVILLFSFFVWISICDAFVQCMCFEHIHIHLLYIIYTQMYIVSIFYWCAIKIWDERERRKDKKGEKYIKLSHWKRRRSIFINGRR